MDEMAKNSLSNKVLEMWKKEQCPSCRTGDRSKCTVTPETAKAIRTSPNGKTHHYCFIGCLMLELDDNARKTFIESQFNSEGHYEQLANSLASYRQ